MVGGDGGVRNEASSLCLVDHASHASLPRQRPRRRSLRLGSRPLGLLGGRFLRRALLRLLRSARGLAQDLARDDEALDLVRALVDLRDLGVAHVLLDRVILHVPVAAEELDGVRRDLHGRVGREELAHRRELADVLRAAVDDARGVVDELPGGLDLCPHVGEHPLDPLEGGDALPELLPVARVVDGELEGALREPERLRGNAGTRAVERHHRVFEAHSLAAAEEVLRGHAAVLEVDLDDGNAPDPHLVLFLALAVPRHAVLDEQGGDAPAPPVRVGDAEDRVDGGDLSAGVPLLLAVEDVVIAILDRAGLHAPRVGPGLLLREAEGDEPLARGDVRQEALLLLFGPGQDDGERAEGVDGVGHADAPARAGELLDHEAEVEHAAPLAAVLLGDPDARELRLLELLEDLPGVRLVAVVLRGDLANDPVGDGAGAFLVFDVLRREQLVHRLSLLVIGTWQRGLRACGWLRARGGRRRWADLGPRTGRRCGRRSLRGGARAHDGRGRGEPEGRADLRLEVGHHVGIVAQELLRVLAPLPDARLSIGDPGAALLEELVVDPHVDEVAGPRDALPVHDVELGGAEGDGDLVLHDLELGAAADGLLALLDRADPADVDPDRGVELQGAAAGRRLGVAEHDADLLADLVDEDEARLRLRDVSGQLAQRLRHEPRVEPDVPVAHLALELRARNQSRDRVHDADVQCAGSNQDLEDLESLLAGVGLRDEEVVDVDAQLPGILRIHGVLGVDERRDAAAALRLGHGVQSQRRLAGRLRPEDLDDAPTREAPDPEGPVDGQGARGDGGDLDRFAAPELHDGALSELLLDLADGDVDRAGLLADVLGQCTPLRFGPGRAKSGSGGNRDSTKDLYPRPGVSRKSSES